MDKDLSDFFDQLGPIKTFEFIGPLISIVTQEISFSQKFQTYEFDSKNPSLWEEALITDPILKQLNCLELAKVILKSFVRSDNPDLIWYRSATLTYHQVPILKVDFPQREAHEPKSYCMYIELDKLIKKYEEESSSWLQSFFYGIFPIFFFSFYTWAVLQI